MACKDEMRMFSCFTLDVMGLNETGIYENLQFLLDNCRASGAIFFFPSHLFGRMKVHWYKAVLLGSFQAQTVFILASLQMCLR